MLLDAARPEVLRRELVGIGTRSDEPHLVWLEVRSPAECQHATGQHAELLRRHGIASITTASLYAQLHQLPCDARVDVAAPPQLPAVGVRPGGAHACGCVLREPDRAEQPGQQIWRQQEINAPRRERRHLGDEGVGLVLALARALAGGHGQFHHLGVRERGEARRVHGAATAARPGRCAGEASKAGEITRTRGALGCEWGR